MTDSTNEQVIRQHVVWALGAGLLPLPVADFIAVSAVQLDLIRQLCVLHDIPYAEATGKVWVGALTGGAIARMGASALKAIPGFGTVIGGLSMSIASGASTYAVGKAIDAHLSSGGTMGNLDVEAAKRRYAEEYEKGKDVAQRASKEAKNAQPVAERLEALAAMKAKGLITDAEYDAKKAKLLEEL